MSLVELKPSHECFTDERYEAVTGRDAAQSLLRGYRGDAVAMHQLREMIARMDMNVFRHDDNTLLEIAAAKIAKGEILVKKDPCERKNEKNRKYLDWIKWYGTDTIDVAFSLRNTLPNILGLAAFESDFGNNRYATFGNNFFKLMTDKDNPFPGQIGMMMDMADPKMGMAKFSNYLASAWAFAQTKGQFIVGETNPERFASILQDRAKFGVNARGPIPGYIDELTNVIHEIAIRVNCAC
ncbi:MAG TPA: hypothetical protein VKU19_36040 [Bryobacteraceae bacterium]|nr:hypothetical protein [Bryobacteraceae bacterium]